MASPKVSRGSWLATTGQFLRTEPGLVTACALLLALLYYAAWGGLTLSHSSVSFGFIALGLKYIWDGRAQLQQEHSYPEERFMGYALAGCGLALFFWLSSSASFQYLAFVITLAGMALALWGATFFVRQGFASVLIAIGLYPDLIFLTNSLWRLATPRFLLENAMGQWAGRALALIGQPVVVEGRFIGLGKGAVEVASGCSGFDMAVSMAAVGLLMGLFYRQAWPKIGLAIGLGIILALIVNIPRVMLLAYVVGHYDEAVFKFWHGPWGGQIFMALLFTPYYYLVMAIFDSDSSVKSAK
jgi:exosortase